MYTVEEKTRAVELYVKYGKRAAATIRELGYPSRAQHGALRRRAEAGRRGALPVPREMQRVHASRAGIPRMLESPCRLG